MARAKRADSDLDSDDLKPAPARGRKKAPAAAGATAAKGKKVERKKRPRQSDDEGEAASGKAGNGDKSLGARLAVKKIRATEAPPSATEVVEKSSVGPTTLEDKYRALKNARETDAERLLRQARELALAEQKTHEALVARLRRELAAATAKVEKLEQRVPDQQSREPDKKSSTKAVDKETQRRLDTLQRKHTAVLNENETLRLRMRDLETQFAQFKRSTGPDDKVIVSAAAADAWKASETSMQLAQANKLLDFYRLVTSTDIRLIESAEDDEDEEASDRFTEIACATTDGESGKRFNFELAIPDSRTSEIDFLPSEHPTKGLKVPSYLQDELSFKRSEMTKFMRTVLDVVTRKSDEGQSKR